MVNMVLAGFMWETGVDQMSMNKHISCLLVIFVFVLIVVEFVCNIVIFTMLNAGQSQMRC